MPSFNFGPSLSQQVTGSSNLSKDPIVSQQQLDAFEPLSLDAYSAQGQLPPEILEYIRRDMDKFSARQLNTNTMSGKATESPSGVREVVIPGLDKPLQVKYDNFGSTINYIDAMSNGSNYAHEFRPDNGQLFSQGNVIKSSGGILSDFGPMILAGLGANLFGGMNLLGGAAGAAGGATAADIAASNALAGANLAGYAGTDLAATAAGAGATSLADIATKGGFDAASKAAADAATAAGAGGGASAADIAAHNALAAANTAGGLTPAAVAAAAAAGGGGSLLNTLGSGVKSVLDSGVGSGLGSVISGIGSGLGSVLGSGTGLGSVISGLGNVTSGVLSANAAKDAAQIQADAATKAAQMQMDMFNTVNAQGAPYRGAGYNALNQIGSMLPGQYTKYDASGKPIGTDTGTGYLTQQFGPEQFAQGIDPGYAFRLQQGQMANQRASNLAGGLIGGNALQGMQDYTQGMASQEYGNAFNRFQTQRGNIYNTLAGIAGIGQTAQGQANQMAQNNATAQGQLGVGAAAAQAAGKVGQATGYGGAATGLGNSYLLSQLLNQNQGVAGSNVSGGNFTNAYNAIG